MYLYYLYVGDEWTHERTLDSGRYSTWENLGGWLSHFVISLIFN